MTSILLNPSPKNRSITDLIVGEDFHRGGPVEVVTDGRDFLFLGVQFPCLRFLQCVTPAGIEFHFPHPEGILRNVMSLHDFLLCMRFFFHHAQCSQFLFNRMPISRHKKTLPNRINRFVISSVYLLGSISLE